MSGQNETTIFVIADERFGDTQVFAADELERAILELSFVFGDGMTEGESQGFRDAAEYFDMSNEIDKGEFDDCYGEYVRNNVCMTEAADAIINS